LLLYACLYINLRGRQDMGAIMPILRVYWEVIKATMRQVVLICITMPALV